MTSQEKVIADLVHLASTDRKTIRLLKNVAVKSQNFELAYSLRTMELEKYPQANTHNDDYVEAKKFAGCLNMVGLKTTIRTAYNVLRTARAFETMKENFDLDTASKIIYDTDNVFGEEE